MARVTLQLTKEQMDKIKKATGVNVKKLRLVQPTKAEETKAMRKQALPKAALRKQALPKAALRKQALPKAALRKQALPKAALRKQALPKAALRAGPKPAATPLFEGVPIPPGVK